MHCNNVTSLCFRKKGREYKGWQVTWLWQASPHKFPSGRGFILALSSRCCNPSQQGSMMPVVVSACDDLCLWWSLPVMMTLVCDGLCLWWSQSMWSNHSGRQEAEGLRPEAELENTSQSLLFSSQWLPAVLCMARACNFPTQHIAGTSCSNICTYRNIWHSNHNIPPFVPRLLSILYRGMHSVHLKSPHRLNMLQVICI